MLLGFKKPTNEDWLNKINKDLNGKKTIHDLDYIFDNMKFSNFKGHDTNNQSKSLYLSPSKSSVLCLGNSTEEKNTRAMQCLEWGVESLAFELSSDDDINELFKGIYLEMVDVFCYAECKTDIAVDYNFTSKNIHIIQKDRPTYLCLTKSETIVERIQKFKRHINSGVLETLFLDVYLKDEFLPQIAELRAIRHLWAQANNDQKLHIITHIPEIAFKNEEIHPLIVCNYLIMSARMGMADFVMGFPFSADAELTRLSINIQHILTEESRLSEVSDPTSGSYLIEEMTQQFINL